MLLNPCFEHPCLRQDRDYHEECKKFCDYAWLAKDYKRLQEEFANLALNKSKSRSKQLD